MSSNDDQDETLPLDEIHAGGFGSPVSSQRPPLPNNLVHSSPMVILSSQRDRGSAQWSQSAQGTPIRTSQHVAPRGDLGGRTPATLRGLRDVIPNTPMDGGVIGATQTLPTGMTRRNLSEQPDESDEDNDDFLKSTQPFVPTSLTQAQIWGTEINVQHCVNAFSSFLEHFSLDAQSGLSHYAQVFVDMCNEGSSVLNLDCGHLLRYAATRSLYDQLVRYPQEIIPLLDEVATSLYHSLNLIHNPHYTAPDQPAASTSASPTASASIQVRPHSLTQVSKIRSLDPEQIESLVTVRGMVLKVGGVIPEIKLAYYMCQSCMQSVEVGVERGRVQEPSLCPSCQSGGLYMVYNKCIYTDRQSMKMQETVEEVPPGVPPLTLPLSVFDDLVDSVRPGDRVEVTGIFRAVCRRVNPNQRTSSPLFHTYIDVVHFKVIRGGRGGDTRGAVNLPPPSNPNAPADSNAPPPPLFTEEEVSYIEAFATLPNVVDKLTSLFAPSVWGLADVKKGLLCLLVGGHGSGHAGEGGGIRIPPRGDLNVLLCGDPGTSKSQLLTYTHSLSPRGIYTSGKGASAVGLTASVAGTGEGGERVLESGALVLSDGGICVIDEFDKMGENARGVLLEAMEAGSVSLSKGGIIATLRARCSILASANPKKSRYDPTLSVLDNITLPPPLLSRFDLVYLVLDRGDREGDRMLARHIVGLYRGAASKSGKMQTDDSDGEEGFGEFEDDGMGESKSTTQKTSDPGLEWGLPTMPFANSQDFLRAYINYTRHYVHPIISDEVKDMLVQEYVKLRGGGRTHYHQYEGSDRSAEAGGFTGSHGGKGCIYATPRQLESLIRLGRAWARLRLSNNVTTDDVSQAVMLMRVATLSAATDPRTGALDMALLGGGGSGVGRGGEGLRVLGGVVLDVLRGVGGGRRKMTLAQVRQAVLQYARTHSNPPILPPPLPPLSNVSVMDIENAVRELTRGSGGGRGGEVQYVESSQSVIYRGGGDS